MAKFKIYSASGVEKAVGYLSFTGTYMKAGVLDFREIASPTPIAWAIGDYVDYTRTGRRYKLYTIPQVKKQARSGSYGGAFIYQNVQFFDDSHQGDICPFRDLVPGDNRVHFSTQPQISVFDNVAGIAERLQACLEDMYGAGSWVVRTATAQDGASQELLDLMADEREFVVSGVSITGALEKVYEIWPEVGFVYTIENGVNTFIIGGAGLNVNEETYKYGKGYGLTSLSKVVANADDMANRLYVYGSARNMLARWYSQFDIKDADSVDIQHLMLPISVWGETGGKPDPAKAFIETEDAEANLRPKTVYFDGSGDLKEIYPTIRENTIQDLWDVMPEGADYRPDTSVWEGDERIDKLLSAQATFDSGLAANNGKSAIQNISWDASVSSSTSQTIRPNISIPLFARDFTLEEAGSLNFDIVLNVNGTVALPGAQKVVLRARVHKGSAETQPTFIDQSIELEKSVDSEAFILAPASFSASRVQFDSTRTILVSFFLEIATNASTGTATLAIDMDGSLNVAVSRYRAKTFTVSLRQLGFDISAQADLGEGKTMVMRSGKCVGRAFKISSTTYNSATDTWNVELIRSNDESLSQWFPNSAYPVEADDEFVLTEIAMPGLYISLAEIKLLAAARELLADTSKEQWQYTPDIDAKFMVESGRTILPATNVTIEDEIVPGGSVSMLVDSVTINEGDAAIPTYKVTLRDKKRKSYSDKASVQETSSVPVSAPGQTASKAQRTVINDSFFEEDGDGGVKLKDEYAGLWAKGYVTAGGVGSGGGGGGGLITDVYRIGDFGGTFGINDNDTFNAYAINSLYTSIQSLNTAVGSKIDRAVLWASLQNNDIVSTYNNYKIALAHIPDDDRLSYVDPEAGEEITIDDPGTTGTVLWGAESANNVALDVNGVSKILVKQAALDGINSSISNLQSLVATKQDYISDLASIRSNASLGATAYGWGDHSTEGYLKSITSQMVTTALGYTPFNAASFTKANIQSTLGISNWALESTKPSYTFSEIGSKPTTLAGYGITDAKFSSAGVADKIRITLGSNYHDVLTAHQSLSGYATEAWVGQQGFITKTVNDLANYYLKSQTYTQAEVNALIAAINQFHYEVYPSTSSVTDPQSNVLYLIGPTGSGSDKYEEYVYTTQWVKIGDTSIDLTPYLLASVAAQTYVPLTRTVNGHALSSDVTVTKGDVGLGSVDNIAASAYFTVLENSGDQLSATIGDTNKKLTIGYATIATKTRFTPTESGATQIEPLLDWFVPETYTESGVSKVRLRLNPKYTGMYADGFVTAGGAGSGSVTPTSLDAVWNTLRYNTGDYQDVEIDPGHLKTITLTGVVTGSGKTSITTSIADGALTIAKTSGLQSALDAKANTSSLGSFAYKNSLSVSDIPLDDRLSYVDPEAGEEITIDDPGTTGTVLWGAESANNVALDVNGVSKTLVKQAAMDSVYSSISTLSALIGTKQDYISDLSSIRSNASLGATAYSWGDHRQAGYLTSVPMASASVLGLIRIGQGLAIDGNGVVSVTEQTQGTVTRVYVGSTAYNPDADGYVTLPLYAFGTAGTDYVPITIGSTTKNVLTAHQTLPTALKNPYKLTWGTNNEYDGSTAVTITAAQLGALTSHQTVTLASGTNNGTLKITTAAGTTDNVAVTGLGTAAYRGIATTIGSSITNLVPGSLLYSVLGDAFDSSNTVVAFVNSSIATATATFRGTNDTATTESAFLTWANSLTHDLNDYVFWKTADSVGNVVYKRYKYNGTSWAFEYDLNNSSFTAAQWSAINSGITSTLVAAFNAKYDKPAGGIPKEHLDSSVQTSLGKADTALQAAFAGSSNIVTLGTITTGVWHGSKITQGYLDDIGWELVGNSAVYDSDDYIHVN